MDDYPKTLKELNERFATEKSCREYLAELRWRRDFLCPKCTAETMWKMNNGLMLCKRCRHQTSVIQGTIFQDSHLQLRTWFNAMWYSCVPENGTNAAKLQKTLNLGSYRTAWTVLHKLRKAMMPAARERLHGVVDIDIKSMDKEKSRKVERGNNDKTLVLIAAKHNGKNVGQMRLAQ